MINIVESFKKIQLNINKIVSDKKVNVIAVSKTFPLTHIQPLIDYGHLHFGENKVQEAVSKWALIKKDNENIKLHMVGKLQSNKAKDAVKLFDYIHSLDNQKLADTLAKNQINLGKELKYFIQVNIGNEIQKSGVPVNEIDSFYNYCIKSAKLNVIGLMIIWSGFLFFKGSQEGKQKLFDVLMGAACIIGFAGILSVIKRIVGW